MIDRYKNTIAFYSFSALIPWLLWSGVAYLSHKDVQSSGLLFLQQLFAMGGLASPFFVALFYIYKDENLIQDFKSRFVNFSKFHFIYTVLSVGLIFLSMVVAQLLSLLLGHSLDQFHISGKPSFTSFLFSPWLILISAPILEELAWHCYGTDTLRRKFNLFVTSMIFAAYWVVWHLPLSFVKGYYHSNVVAEGTIYALNFVFSLFVFVILMNWLYYKTKRNIVITILFHLSANISNEIFATHPDSKVIQTVLLLGVSLYVLFKDRDMFFQKKHTE